MPAREPAPGPAPGRSSAAPPWAAPAAALAIWICLLGQVNAAAQGVATALPCDPAVVVDGALRCGPEAERVVVCGAAGACAAGLRSGDVAVSAVGCAVRVGRMAGDDLEALQVAVDLNSASQEELASLPGIGPELARRIAAARPLERVEDLDDVSGIGPRRLAALRNRARVGFPECAGPEP